MDVKLIPDKYILKRWTKNARSRSVQDLHGLTIQIDPKSQFTDRYRELCPKMVQLVNRASESHEAYMFLSKVHQEASKIVEQILARNCNDSYDGNLGTPHISYMLDNGKDYNPLDAIHGIKAKGLKKKENPHKGRKRLKSWPEKISKKTKLNHKKIKETQVPILSSYSCPF